MPIPTRLPGGRKRFIYVNTALRSGAGTGLESFYDSGVSFRKSAP